MMFIQLIEMLFLFTLNKDLTKLNKKAKFTFKDYFYYK